MSMRERAKCVLIWFRRAGGAEFETRDRYTELLSRVDYIMLLYCELYSVLLSLFLGVCVYNNILFKHFFTKMGQFEAA